MKISAKVNVDKMFLSLLTEEEKHKVITDKLLQEMKELINSKLEITKSENTATQSIEYTGELVVLTVIEYEILKAVELLYQETL